MHFRDIDQSDIELQKALLLVALWTSDDEPNPEPEILELPHMKEYYEQWGKDRDLAILALDADEQPMGLVQIRKKSSVTTRYAEFPELAMAVFPQYQGRGVGSRLLSELFRRISGKESGLRLGVNPKNRGAIALYEKFGFSHYETPEKGYPQMVWIKD